MQHTRLARFHASPSFDAGRGLRIGRVTVSGGETRVSGDIRIERHQDKHAAGDWHHHGRSGSTFGGDIASKSRLDKNARGKPGLITVGAREFQPIVREMDVKLA